ncbi:MAG: GNAT family N-acetyltransferase [Planctomycetes bacterium]|nr:GNAT family N-acetyltransferase [Planctomycetota bacterium]
MGLDTQLIADGTYFVVEADGSLTGCGGWSRRATMYGADHTPGRDAVLLDPARDAARVRAMFTHPNHTRKGVGRLLLSLSEEAARRDGFKRVELMATMAGEPFYRACVVRGQELYHLRGDGHVLMCCLARAICNPVAEIDPPHRRAPRAIRSAGSADHFWGAGLA